MLRRGKERDMQLRRGLLMLPGEHDKYCPEQSPRNVTTNTGASISPVNVKYAGRKISCFCFKKKQLSVIQLLRKLSVIQFLRCLKYAIQNF